MLREKVVVLVVDGLGDVSVPMLGERTPLEVAHTPCFDAVAAAGLNGLLDPVEPGLACGSDTAHMSIFGYDPRQYYRGRGAFESMGAGIHMEPGDIAFKCNFATLNAATGIVESRRADRNFEHLGPTLCAALDGLPISGFPDHRVRCQYATEHRCGIAVSGPGLCDAVSGTDPLKDNRPLQKCAALDGSAEAELTARLVNELSSSIRAVLDSHPINRERQQQGLSLANCVLLRGCGSRLHVPGFQQRHGMKAAIVAPTKIIAGLGMSFGMEVVVAEGATGGYHTDLSSKARTMSQAVAGGDAEFGVLHVKAVDDCGHDRRVQMKVLFLQAVDAMLGQLLRQLWAHEQASNGTQRFALVITGDHSTPVLFGDHSHEPVPFVIAHVAHAVESMGAAHVAAIPLGPIPLPDVDAPSSFASLCKQAEWEEARRKASWAGRPWLPFLPAEVFGPWRDPWPLVVRGDAVRCFDELSAARGALGRFPGSQVMPLIKAFTGRDTVS